MEESFYGDQVGRIEYQEGYANSSTDGIYEIRSLIRNAFAHGKTHTCGISTNDDEKEKTV
jgi:hypothetical protein